MTIGALLDYIVKICFTTSDKGAYALHSLYKSNSAMHETAMKEYIYLKVFFAQVACARAIESKAQEKEAHHIMVSIFTKMSEAFKSMPSSLNYGCNEEELADRISVYSQVEIADSIDFSAIVQFYKVYVNDHSLLHQNQLMVIFSQVYEDMVNKLASTANGSNGAGCGCTSVIACMSLLFAALMAMVIL